MGERVKLLHLYMGEGKGKTTASMGLAPRAVGNGWRAHPFDKGIWARKGVEF